MKPSLCYHAATVGFSKGHCWHRDDYYQPVPPNRLEVKELAANAGAQWPSECAAAVVSAPHGV